MESFTSESFKDESKKVLLMALKKRLKKNAKVKQTTLNYNVSNNTDVHSVQNSKHTSVIVHPPNQMHHSIVEKGIAEKRTSHNGSRQSITAIFDSDAPYENHGSNAVSQQSRSPQPNFFFNSQLIIVLHGSRDRLYPVPVFCQPPPYLFVNDRNPLLSAGFNAAGVVTLQELCSVQETTKIEDQLTPCELLLLTVQDADIFVQSINEQSSHKSNSFVGKLTSMCSYQEMIKKQQTSTANDLERLPAALQGDPEARLVNRYIVAKSFQRSDANKVFKESDVRPMVWCRKTIQNLLALHLEADCKPSPWHILRGDDLIKRPLSIDAWEALTMEPHGSREHLSVSPSYKNGFHFIDVYNFLRDRFRSVWQDLTVQHCPKHRAFIESLEISFRFLVLSEQILCEEKSFNAVQNGDLMNTCLDKLLGGYADSRYSLQSLTSNLPSHTTDTQRKVFSVLVYTSPHEAEFWAYRIIMTLPNSLENCNAMLDVYRRIPAILQQHSYIRLAMEAHRAFRDRNACRYFKISRKAHYLLSTLLHKFADLVRVAYLDVLVSRSSQQKPRMPFQTFCHQFGFCEESLEHVKAFCNSYQLQLLPEPPPDSSSSTQWKINYVCFSRVDTLTAADMQLKRLKCQQFKSTFLTSVWDKQKLNRQTTVDPDFSYLTYDAKDTLKPTPSVSPVIISNPTTERNLPIYSKTPSGFNSLHATDTGKTKDVTIISKDRGTPMSYEESMIASPPKYDTSVSYTDNYDTSQHLFSNKITNSTSNTTFISSLQHGFDLSKTAISREQITHIELNYGIMSRDSHKRKLFSSCVPSYLKEKENSKKLYLIESEINNNEELKPINSPSLTKTVSGASSFTEIAKKTYNLVSIETEKKNNFKTKQNSSLPVNYKKLTPCVSLYIYKACSTLTCYEKKILLESLSKQLYLIPALNSSIEEAISKIENFQHVFEDGIKSVTWNIVITCSNVFKASKKCHLFKSSYQNFAQGNLLSFPSNSSCENKKKDLSKSNVCNIKKFELLNNQETYRNYILPKLFELLFYEFNGRCSVSSSDTWGSFFHCYEKKISNFFSNEDDYNLLSNDVKILDGLWTSFELGSLCSGSATCLQNISNPSWLPCQAIFYMLMPCDNMSVVFDTSPGKNLNIFEKEDIFRHSDHSQDNETDLNKNSLYVSNSLELTKSSSFVPMMSQYLRSHLVWIIPCPVMFCTTTSEENLQPLHTTWKVEHQKLIDELFLRRCLQHEYENPNISFTIFYGLQINDSFSHRRSEIKYFILKIEENIQSAWKVTVKEEEKNRARKCYAWQDDFFNQLYALEVICFPLYEIIVDEACAPPNLINLKTDSCYVRLVSKSLIRFCKDLSQKISSRLIKYFNDNLDVPETYRLKKKKIPFFLKVQNLSTETTELEKNALFFPPVSMEEPKLNWPTFFFFKWKELEIQSIPLLLIHNWKVQVAQCVMNKSCPSVRDLTKLLLDAFEKIKLSIYFHPFFWNKAPPLQYSVSLKDPLPIVVSERCLVQSLFEYLHDQCRLAYTQTNFELDKTLHNFNSVGEFITYVRGCIRWILDFATSTIPHTFLWILPYPFYTELIGFCKSPWNELPFPPQYYSGAWNFFTVNSKTRTIETRENDREQIICKTKYSTLSSNLEKELQINTTGHHLSKKLCPTILYAPSILPNFDIKSLTCTEKGMNSQASTNIPASLFNKACHDVSNPIPSLLSCKSFSVFPSPINLMNISFENEKQEEESYNLLKKRLNLTFQKLKSEIAQNYVSTNTFNQYCENSTF